MPITYTSNLGLALPADGTEPAEDWGQAYRNTMQKLDRSVASTVAGNPNVVGLTPEFRGQLVMDTSVGVMFYAQSVSPAIWQVVGPPIGTIMPYWVGSGSTIAPPPYHVICQGGGLVSRSDGQGTIQIPDLRNRFVMGGDNSSTVSGQTGGSDYVTPSGSVATTVHGHALTIAQMPSHRHSITHAVNGYDIYNGGPYSPIAKYTSSAHTNYEGGSQAHAHGASSSFSGYQQSNRPRYMVLVFVMRN